MYPEKSLLKFPSNYGKMCQKPVETTYFQKNSPGEEEGRSSTKCLELSLPSLSQVRMGRNIKPISPEAKKKKPQKTKPNPKKPQHHERKNQTNQPKTPNNFFFKIYSYNFQS